MRSIVNIDRKWAFRKNGGTPETFPVEWDIVNLPHSWNNIDGRTAITTTGAVPACMSAP